jgi:hypothetical protein
VFPVKYLIHFRVFSAVFLTSCSIFEGGVSISFKLCHSQLVLDKAYSFQLPLFVSEIINNTERLLLQGESDKKRYRDQQPSGEPCRDDMHTAWKSI